MSVSTKLQKYGFQNVKDLKQMKTVKENTEKKGLVGLLIVYHPECGHCKNAANNQFRLLGERLQKERVNVWMGAIDGSDPSFKNFLSGLKVVRYPTVFIIVNGQYIALPHINPYYVYKTLLSDEVLTNLRERGTAPKIAFDEIFEYTLGDGILVVYAPWCGHCKRASQNEFPRMIELMERYNDTNGKNNWIAFLDGDDLFAKNLADRLNVQSFPSVYMKKNGKVTLLSTRDPENVMSELYS